MGLEAHQRAVAAAKREAILEAARRLFGAQGFSKVTMNAVAKEASVSLATVYKHFSGKEELFDAIVLARCDGFVAGLAGVQLAGMPLREGVTLFARAYAEHLAVKSTAETLRLLIAEVPTFPHVAERFLQRIKSRLQAPLRRFLREHRDGGEVRFEDEDRAVRELLGMIEGGVLWGMLLGRAELVTESTVQEVAASAARTWLLRYAADA